MINGVKDQNSVLGTTLKAGAIGAGMGAAGELISQKIVLKNPEKMIDSFEKTIEEFKDSKFSKKLANYLERSKDETLKIVESGKVNKKLVAKAGLQCGAVVAGVYLVCKGISSLFSKKED